MSRPRSGFTIFAYLLLAFLLFSGAIGAWQAMKGQRFVSGPYIAKVEINGPIFDPKETLRQLRKVEQNGEAKGLLLVVDSPGGAVVPSMEIHDAVARIAKKMPVAVSMQSLAASGAYMISCAGTRIFAYGATATGSIGVILQTFSLTGLMDKLGVQANAIVSGPYKDAGSPFAPMTDADRSYLHGIVMNIRDQFVDLVARDRHLPVPEVSKLATGQVFTGLEAQKLGLVDAIGGENAAKGWLLARLKLPVDTPVRNMAPKELEWSRWVGDTSSAALAGLFRRLSAQIYLF